MTSFAPGKTRIMSGAVLAVTLLVCFGPTAVAGQDQQVYNTGRNAVFEERWQDVRRIFEEFARRYPDSPYADDARYWLGMALYEMGQAERAYAVLKSMNTRFPESPWSDDARVLMVRCAESVLKAAAGRGRAGRPDRSQKVPRVSSSPPRVSLAEYEAFIEQSTHDTSSKVQLLAIDTILLSRPEKAAELLPRLSGGRTSPEATEMVLDRFFGGDRVKVTMEDPGLGLTDENLAVIVREADRVTHLTLSEAIDLVGPSVPPARHGHRERFDRATLAEIRDKLLGVERSLVRESDEETLEPPAGRGRTMSAIIRVVDGEVHYYRSVDETVRIVVFRREAGFNPDNIRIFVDGGGRIRPIGLEQARALPPDGSGTGLRPATVRYLKATLALIELDLARLTGTRAR